MSILSLTNAFQGAWRIIGSVLDILIIWLVIYYSLKVIRTNTRTTQIFKGIFFVIFIDIIAKIIGLKTIQFIADMFINWGFLAIIIIFQPEIRSLLEKLGKSTFFSRFSVMSNDDKSEVVEAIVTAATLLSKDQTGALITLGQSASLENYINTGTKLEAKISAELLTSIFVTSTPLHDGAVIIQGDRVVCASAYFPPTNRVVSSRFGSRHRAAIGISEVTDAITIVISEETGSISIAREGNIETVSPAELRRLLKSIVFNQVTKDNSSAKLNPFNSKMTVNNSGAMTVVEIHDGHEEIYEQSQKDNLDWVAKSAGMKLPHKKEKTKASYPERIKPTLSQEEVERLRDNAIQELDKNKGGKVDE
ncbi:diadenylate cyclase CdaA [Bulleidia sp. zg-1006]|uniref:diadenylate cyclase CdaA n=1 Tax=Bulleidia sp. zg-1006 TaxID=2806552 RepID=UPI001939B2D4|nr:diadenylate cyclase CdaA [Bulleidia sp. zg-1006]QRG86358.1 TIGR00159 family protein [Bulleidia sp. zg-1006]